MFITSQIERPPREPIAIRSLWSTDAAACTAFSTRLDARDIRMRFASLRSATAYFLPERMLADGGVAFVAVSAAQAIFGIANLAYLNPVAAELAIIVRSDRKRRGIGRTLLAHAIRWAEGDGLSRLVGYVLAENRPMLALAQSMEFRRTRRDELLIEIVRPIFCNPA